MKTRVNAERNTTMSKFVYHVGFMMALFAFALPVFPGDERELTGRLIQHLVGDGFENVAALQAGKELIVTYENRRYRDELTAAREVIAGIQALAREELEVTLLPQNRKIPLVAIHVAVPQPGVRPNGESPAPLSEVALEVALNFDSSWSKIKTLPRANASTGKLDLVLHPQFNVAFASYNNPVATQVNLAPALQTSLWPGMAFFAQIIIPLQNELARTDDYVRPGLVTINQTLRMPREVFLSASMGYFTQERYGLDLNVQKYFFNGGAAVGANFGYTGHASYLKGVWSYSAIKHQTMFLHSEIRIPRWDAALRATYGKFLYQDTGWRMEVTRQFREVDFGFFLLRSAAEMNTGFYFSVPIFPRKHLKPGRVRVRTADYFSWEYFYKGFPESGTRYQTGNRLNDFMKRLHPDYVRNQIRRHSRWEN